MSTSRATSTPNIASRQPTTTELNTAFQAATNGDINTIKQLYASGLVNLNQPKAPGCATPAHVAAECGYADMITLFHENDECHLSVWDHNGMTPACAAATRGHVSVIKALSVASVNLNQPNRDGNTPLHFAIFGRDLSLALTLREAGANLNIPNHKGITPAMAAIDVYCDSSLSALLAWNAGLLERTPAGYTLLEYARFRGAARCIQLLESRYQQLNIPIPTSSMQTDMPLGWKNANGYREGSEVSKTEFHEQFSHVVHQATKIAPTEEVSQSLKYTSIWFKKHSWDRIRAQREIVAQELFRLFIPGHPKTRLAIDNQNNTFVLSKGIPHYECISDVAIRIGKTFHPPASESMQNTFKLKETGLKIINRGLSDYPDAPGIPPDYTQLGYLIIMSLWVHEFDFRLGNISIEHGKFKKIDGDFCFRGLEFPDLKASFQITADLIDKLPYIGSYHVMNWLDHLRGSKHELNPTLVIDDVNNKWFRKELNEMMLKIILMPPILLRCLVEHHMVKAAADQCMDFLLERAEQLRRAALQNKSFRSFMKTPAAMSVKNALIEDISCFHMTKKTKLDTDSSRISEGIHARFTDLISQLTIEKCQALQLSQCSTSNGSMEQSSHLAHFGFLASASTNAETLLQYVDDAGHKSAKKPIMQFP